MTSEEQGSTMHEWIEEDRGYDALPTYDEAKAALAAWHEGGGRPEDLPANAVHFVLACYGAESNPAGTGDMLEALTEGCDACFGEGVFDGDEPGDRSEPCKVCHGFGRLPRRAAPVGWVEGCGPPAAVPGDGSGK